VIVNDGIACGYYDPEGQLCLEKKMDNIHPNLSLEFRGQVVIATLTDEKILDEDQLQGLRPPASS
jgi:hypothetical protein